MIPKERELVYVPRWSIIRVNKRQSVAEHCYFVARYAIEICGLLGVPCRSDFISYVLRHDDEELHSGDIPTPYKNKNGLHTVTLEYDALFDYEKRILKIADMLEAILYLVDEELLGNATVDTAKELMISNLSNVSYDKLIPSMNNMSLFDYLLNVIHDHREYKGRDQ
jgi:5'-deoxynucleotidase YfbR-like HD superfamily hydrolase